MNMLHRPKPQTHAFAQANIVGQKYVRRKIKIKADQFLFLQCHGTLRLKILDHQINLAVNLPVNSFGK